MIFLLKWIEEVKLKEIEMKKIENPSNPTNPINTGQCHIKMFITMRIFVIFSLFALSFSSCALFQKGSSSTGIEETEIASGAGIHVIEGYSQINTFENLLKPFKGKVVLVDIWATWCGPCRREFQYENDLLEFIKDKDVELLFISADNENQWKRWESFIADNHLQGYHILANDLMLEDLREQFYDRVKSGRKVLVLPTFIIVDKNGKIVNKKAARPSQQQHLYNQLSEYLK